MTLFTIMQNLGIKLQTFVQIYSKNYVIVCQISTYINVVFVKKNAYENRYFFSTRVWHLISFYYLYGLSKFQNQRMNITEVVKFLLFHQHTRALNLH